MSLACQQAGSFHSMTQKVAAAIALNFSSSHIGQNWSPGSTHPQGDLDVQTTIQPRTWSLKIVNQKYLEDSLNAYNIYLTKMR